MNEYYAAIYDDDIWGISTSEEGCMADAEKHLGPCDAPLAEQLTVVAISDSVYSHVCNRGGDEVMKRVFRRESGVYDFSKDTTTLRDELTEAVGHRVDIALAREEFVDVRLLKVGKDFVELEGQYPGTMIASIASISRVFIYPREDSK